VPSVVPPGRAGPDAVVVGGGLVGLCTALYLQRTGRTVTVVERGWPGDGASGHNAGVFSIGNCVPTATPGVVRSVPRMLRDPLSPLAIRWTYLPRLAPWLVRFLLASRRSTVERASVALHSLIELALDAYRPLIAGRDAEQLVRPGGLLYGYLDDRSFVAAGFDIELRARRGVVFEIVDNRRIEQLAPALAGRFGYGLYLPDAPYTVDSRRLTGALAAEMVAAGGELHCADVVDFQGGRRRVDAVVTSAGRIPTEAVVVAAGAWSRRLARRLGVRVPLDTERGYGVDLPDPGVSLGFPVISADHHFALTPTATGLRLSGTDELAGLAAPANYARADRLVEAAQTVFPELRADGATRWMSFRPSLPDALPVIGRAPGYANAYLAFGHGHVGLTLAAITGRLVQELADGKPPSVDLAPFRPDRFGLVGN
jgi:D-amino-acid dehydrogenase